MSTTTRKILFRSLAAWYVVFAAGHVVSQPSPAILLLSITIYSGVSKK